MFVLAAVEHLVALVSVMRSKSSGEIYLCLWITPRNRWYCGSLSSVSLSVFFNQNICWYPVRVHYRFTRVRFFCRRTNYKELIALVKLVKYFSLACSTIPWSLNCKRARFWDADESRKWAIFTLNLSSHPQNIHIAKHLIFIRDG